MAQLLIVDDDADFANAVATVLADAGHKVEVVLDTRSAIASIRKQRPDLVILDVMFPEDASGGFKLAQDLRPFGREPQAPRIVMLTAVNRRFPVEFSDRDIDDAWLPVDAFLDKPIDFDVLRERVSQLLSGGGPLRQVRRMEYDFAQMERSRHQGDLGGLSDAFSAVGPDRTGVADAGREKVVSRAVVFTDSDALKEAYRNLLDHVTDSPLFWTFAESADHAVQSVNPHAGRQTVVVVDVKPSTVDVRKLARAVKQRSPGSQVILVSERLSEHEAWKVRHEGVDEVLVKPLEQGELIKAMSGLRATWPSPALKDDGEIFVERMDISSRIQHMVLIGCFVLLCLSGFPLLFPDSRVFETLFFFSSAPVELRAMLHRFAAVGLILLSLYHLYYILFTQAGRENFRGLLPGKKDLADFVGTLKYNLGSRREPPEYPRFNVFEKVEYLGAFWGNFIMILTGILLWEKTWTLSFAPLWCFDVLRVVHRYEAILALGFVAIWHMYSVHFKAGQFPMGKAFLHGNISLREMKEQYRGWYKEHARQQLGLETSRKR